jgi:hypothetical protein
LIHPLCEGELLSVEPGLDELDWAETTVCALGPVHVVVDAPALKEDLGFEQGIEALAERLVGHDLLQPLVLLLELLESLGVVGLHPSVLVAPTMEGLRSADQNVREAEEGTDGLRNVPKGPRPSPIWFVATRP